MRRILAIILFIVVTIGMGYALWALLFRVPSVIVNEPPQNVNTGPGGGLQPSVNGAPPTGGVTNVNGGLPTPPPPGVSLIAEGGITQVTPVAAASTIGASVSADGSLNYYDRGDGKFYRIRHDGTVGALSGKQFFNVSDATFDNKGDRAIITYPDGSNISYNFATGTQVTLPKHWEDFAFSGDGSRIVAKSISVDPGSRYLVVAGPDGSGARAVQELGENADKVTVAYSPTGQVIATAATGAKLGVDRQEIYMIGQNGENFKSLTVEGLDFRPKWTPSGNQLLYSVAGSGSDWKPQLWIVDGQGDEIGRNRKSINLNTWADKCVFANDTTAYCAAAPSLPRGAGLNQAVADDYPDELYRVDVTTGITSLVATPEGSHTIDKVMLSPDGSMLYFTDKNTGLLNKVQLK